MSSALPAVATTCSTPLRVFFTGLKVAVASSEGWFAYSTDGKSWTPIGGKFHLEYTAPHFTGYRFALYMYSTLKSGGHADFDWFRLSDSVAR